MFVINQCEAFHNVAKQHIINEVTSLAERHHVPEGNASLKNDKFLSKLVVFLAGVAGDVASASCGRRSERKEAPRSTIAPRSKRAQSRAPQEETNRRFESFFY